MQCLFPDISFKLPPVLFNRSPKIIVVVNGIAVAITIPVAIAVTVPIAIAAVETAKGNPTFFKPVEHYAHIVEFFLYI